VRAALTGPNGHLAERRGDVLRYPIDVSPFLALPDDPGAREWADLAALAGPGAVVPLAVVGPAAPAGWETVFSMAGVQMIDDGIPAAPTRVTFGAVRVPDGRTA